MNAPGSDWQVRARRFAATVFLVTIALYVAIGLLRSILPALIVASVVVGIIAAISAAVRARRARW